MEDLHLKIISFFRNLYIPYWYRLGINWKSLESISKKMFMNQPWNCIKIKQKNLENSFTLIAVEYFIYEYCLFLSWISSIKRMWIYFLSLGLFISMLWCAMSELAWFSAWKGREIYEQALLIDSCKTLLLHKNWPESSVFSQKLKPFLLLLYKSYHALLAKLDIFD